jgi:hypothetical protein
VRRTHDTAGALASIRHASADEMRLEARRAQFPGRQIRAHIDMR